METIKESNIRVKVYPRTLNRRGRTYTQFEVRWYDSDGRRRRAYAPTAAAARQFARKKAEELSNRSPLADFHPDDANAAREFLVAVAPLNRSLPAIAADLMEADQLAPGRTASDLARFYARHHEAPTAVADLGQVIERFIASKETEKLISARHRYDLQSRLGAFRVAFNRPLSDITAREVADWWRGLKVANRTRNNYLGAVRNLFNWAERHGLVTAEQRAAVARIEPAITADGENLLWRPEDFEALLAAAMRPWQERTTTDRRGRVHVGRLRTDEAIVPFLTIGAFAKVRTAELHRLDWSHVDMERGEIVITRGVAKTGVARVIPMPDNLRAWLAPFAQRAGRVCPFGDVHKVCRRVAERAGLTWRRNALRNSAINYQTAITGDLARVTLEAGNSPAMARQNYLEQRARITEDARKWFAIYPKERPRMVHLKASSA